MLRSGTTVLVAACALLCAGAAPAAAADREDRVLPPAPGLPAVVVGTLEGVLCVGLDGDDPTDLDQCGDPRRRDDAAIVVDHAALEADHVLAGMVPAGTAAVRIAFASGARVVAPVAPAPARLGPPATQLGFFRVRAPVGAGTRAVWGEALDAAGTPTGVAVLDDAGDGARSAGRRRVLARRGGVPVYGDVRLEEVLQPTLAQLDRVVTRACVELGPQVGGPGGDGEPSSCLVGLGTGALVDADVLPTTGCRPDFAGAQGVLPAGSTGAVAVLGDGRRVALRTSSLAPLAPGRRAFAYVPPEREALRAVELLPSRRRLDLSLAPAHVGCRGAALSGSESAYVSISPGAQAPAAALAGPVEPVRTSAEGTLLGAEGADGTLCLAFDRTELRTDDCAPLRRAPGSVVATRERPHRGRALVAGVAGPAVATVRLTLAGRAADGARRRIDVPTAPALPGAGGAYAGRLRTFLASVPADAVPLAAVGLAASGRALAVDHRDDLSQLVPVLGDRSVPGAPAPTPRSRRLGRPAAGLTAWRVRPTGRTQDACGAVTTGARPRGPLELECRDPQVGPGATAAVRCGSSGTTVTAVLHGRATRLRATTDAGTARVATRYALGGGDALHVLVLGRRRGLRSLAVTGTRSPHRATVGAPPATRQCGYRSPVTLSPGPSR